MDLGVSEKLNPILDEVKNFIDVEIAPLERENFDEVDKGDRWQYTERQNALRESIKDKAKNRNLWNFSLTHYAGGDGLTTV